MRGTTLLQPACMEEGVDRVCGESNGTTPGGMRHCCMALVWGAVPPWGCPSVLGTAVGSSTPMGCPSTLAMTLIHCKVVSSTRDLVTLQRSSTSEAP